MHIASNLRLKKWEHRLIYPYDHRLISKWPTFCSNLSYLFVKKNKIQKVNIFKTSTCFDSPHLKIILLSAQIIVYWVLFIFDPFWSSVLTERGWVNWAECLFYQWTGSIKLELTKTDKIYKRTISWLQIPYCKKTQLE